jgi:REP element-mobilizing transposase RayT
MTLYKDRYRIESTRLKGWDYTSEGWYFVTICTHNKECLLGNMVSGQMRLSLIGEAAGRFWQDIPNHFKQTGLDEFIAMPNHVHGIICINAPFVVIVCNLHRTNLPNPGRDRCLR